MKVPTFLGIKPRCFNLLEYYTITHDIGADAARVQRVHLHPLKFGNVLPS